MKTVSVNRHELISELTVNRDQHRGVFEEALAGYRARLTVELERRIRDVSKGRRIDHHIRLPEPEDHTADYDRIIKMAEMSVRDTIELSDNEFAQYVMDQWHWKQGFTDSTAVYR